MHGMYLVLLQLPGVRSIRYPELEGALHITSATNVKLKSEAGKYSPFFVYAKCGIFMKTYNWIIMLASLLSPSQVDYTCRQEIGARMSLTSQ